MGKLWAVMPAYNEQAAIQRVVEEWIPALRAASKGFVFCALNDGSTDTTLPKLRELAERYPEVLVIDKPNSGHGQTCLEGYRLALAAGAEWIFQLDSDGQCDSRFFTDLWRCRGEHSVVYGYRHRREDGFRRLLISRFVSLFAYFATGVWVRDANVPYRLMSAASLRDIPAQVPADFHLANVLVSVLHQRHFGVHWVNIVFRKRAAGAPAGKQLSFFAKEALRLYRQLSMARQSGSGWPSASGARRT